MSSQRDIALAAVLAGTGVRDAPSAVDRIRVDELTTEAVVGALAGLGAQHGASEGVDRSRDRDLKL